MECFVRFYFLLCDIFLPPQFWLGPVCLCSFLVLQLGCFLGVGLFFRWGWMCFGCICVRRSYNNVY